MVQTVAYMELFSGTLYHTNFCNGHDFPIPVFLSSPYFCTHIGYGTLPQTGQKLKLRWYGHILQPSAGLTKRVPQGTLTLLHSERQKLLAFMSALGLGCISTSP